MYRIRITRPEHPQTLLRLNLGIAGIESYQEVYLTKDAHSFSTLEFVQAVIRQLLDARHDSTNEAAQVAWAFKVHILRFEPWKKFEPTEEERALGIVAQVDELTSPEDWAKRMIKGATLDILSDGHVVEKFAFEVPEDFDVNTLAPLEYGSWAVSETDGAFFAGVVNGYTKPKM